MGRPKKNTGRLLSIAEHARLADLAQQLKDEQAKLADAQTRLVAADGAFATAKEQEDLMERRVLMGRATDEDLGAAQKRSREAQQDRNQAFVDQEAAEKMVRLLPAEIELEKQAARAEIAANLRADYEMAVHRLRDALVAAKDASDEVMRLHDDATREFPPDFQNTRYQMAAHDAGDAGLIPWRAGLPNLSDGFFTNQGYSGVYQPVNALLKRIDAFLAQVPGMVEADKKRRASHDHHEAQREREDEAKRANLAQIERRHRDRYGW